MALESPKPPCTTRKEGASLLILRPARYKLGSGREEDWLRLIAWHGGAGCATSEWPARSRRGAPSTQALRGRRPALIVGPHGSVDAPRNQDPRLLRFSVAGLSYGTIPRLGCIGAAYVGPVNYVFYGVSGPCHS